MAIIRQKSRPFTFQSTPNTQDSQYFRREIERILDYVEQQFALLSVTEQGQTEIIPTARGGLGANFSQIPAFGIPYATQAGKFGWKVSSAFTLGLLGLPNLAAWQEALGIDETAEIPQNTLVGRFSTGSGPTEVVQIGSGLVLDGDTLKTTSTGSGGGGGSSYFPSGW